jgi:hypothetical protein
MQPSHVITPVTIRQIALATQLTAGEAWQYENTSQNHVFILNLTERLFIKQR